MARVTKEEVVDLMASNSFNVASTETWTVQIDTATLLVDTHLIADYAEPILKAIELWLSAHLVGVSNHRQMKQAGGSGNATSIFMGQDGMGLDATTFGQQVKLLDSKGILEAIMRRSGGGHIYAI